MGKLAPTDGFGDAFAVDAGIRHELGAVAKPGRANGMTYHIKTSQAKRREKEMGEGMGLGLAISLGIVEDYGGAIDVQSTVGEGTCFRLTFPVAVGSAGHGAA